MKKNIYIKKGDEKYWKQLKELADEKDRSISYLVNLAIKNFLKKEVKN